ncbi:RagB/SusD family nutrient uptake outer membrane protein [Phocaeicola vulgatus]|nr:RagB/SusD family nutrient uptake outer membrane protein [Phocaeicola vulgatus]MCS2664077.1 RagB/SusD family nutrient uptake outer membrane protein [Phocaeicola vulgatus]MCS3022744.1 RagB/SusD family nutrient uptake outer membrane protein [Phocaeicola vulgatus]MCS3143912.1 RagB/SusD family nutrient uptake outer membrane protein [Phocaeicola vulgatus]
MVYPNYTNPDLSYQAGKSRTWEDKMYLYPIPTGELQRNPQLLPQNPGW